MLGRFMPKNENFFKCFNDAAENIVKGAELLKEIFDSGEITDEKVAKMKDIEHAGDKITHDTVMMLNKTFITPIDREDIHALICSLDDVMDLIDSITYKYALYKVGGATPQAKQLADILLRASVETVRGLKELKKLDLTVTTVCVELNSLENEADKVTREAIALLFDEVKDPFFLIKWKELYESLEEAADTFEDVANIVEGIVLKHA